MAALTLTQHQDACKRGLEKLRDGGKLSRAAKRKVERVLGSSKGLKRFAADVKFSIQNSEGTDTPILDKLQAIVDWFIRNQDKILAIISFIMKIAPLLFIV